MATTIATLVQQFLDHGRYLRGWSPKTTRTYTQAFALFSFDSADDLSKASLQQFVRSLQERGLSPGGINVRLRSVNSLLTWLHEEGHTGERLRVRLLRAPVRTITPLSDHDVRRLVGFKSTVIRMRRVHALAMVLLDTGLRIEEALTLLRTRVDLERRCLTVLGKGSRERTVPISDEGRKALFRWLSKTTSGPYVFCTQRGGRMTYPNAYRDLKALWSSQDLVDTLPAGLVGCFELLWAEPSEMAVTSGSIVEGIDVVGHVRDRELAVFVDLLLDSLLFQAAEERLGDGVVPQVPLQLILGLRGFERQNRRHASLPYWVP